MPTMTQQIADFVRCPDRVVPSRRTWSEKRLAKPGRPGRLWPRLGMANWLSDLRSIWLLWRRRAHDREQILRFTERDLRDAGLTTGDIYRELATPFWKAGAGRARPTD